MQLLYFSLFVKYNMYMKKLIVNQKYNEKKLNTFLFNNIPNLTSNLFYKTLRQKDIKVNGKRVHENLTIYNGDEILVYISDELLNLDINLDIIYEDDNILILNKPYGIEVTGEESLTTCVHKNYLSLPFKPMPCHRIDRNTSGLVLFAKNEQSLEFLFDKFKKHEIEKHYLAWIYGIPKEIHKKCDAYLFKDNKKSMVYINNTFKKGYQKITTIYTIIEKRSDNTCILDVEIPTGKTHQIRAHLAHIGYPIIGDGKYGINEINKKFGKKYQMLCSYILKFNFKTCNGFLDYLNGKKIILDTKVKHY